MYLKHMGSVYVFKLWYRVSLENGRDSDLLLLQGLDEGVLQPVGVLRLQGLLLIGRHALLAEDPPALLLLPVRSEVGSALGAEERLHAGQRPSEFTCRGGDTRHAESDTTHTHTHTPQSGPTGQSQFPLFLNHFPGHLHATTL